MQSMLKKDFWYDLPKELIAQEPADPRDSARLMILSQKDDSIQHRIFRDLPEYLEPGDLLVVNNSKVLPARIVGVKQPTGAVCELLLLRQVKGDQWECLAKPGKRMQPGTKVSFGDGTLTAVVDETLEDGNKFVTFYYDTETLYEKLDEFGKMPLPPYITKQLEDQSQYQTVYAKELGSAAAQRGDCSAHPGNQGRRAPRNRRWHHQLPHAGSRRRKIWRDQGLQRQYLYFSLPGCQVQLHRWPDHQLPPAGKHPHHAGLCPLRLRKDHGCL